MRVGIITFHFVNNFGGVLQAYALRRALEKECGIDAEIIDYRNWFIRLTDRIRLLPISTNVKEIVSGLRTFSERKGRRFKFGTFTKQSNRMSRKYISSRQLKAHPPGDDKYICGSDQIWNPVLTMGVVPCYFLDFEKEPNNKIAYAPSFGTDRISKRIRKCIQKYIQGIGHLSVREQSGQQLIHEITGLNPERLIDPTFLLGKKEWSELGENPLRSAEPYILLYIMQRDEEVYRYAKRVKQQKGIRLVEISRYGYQPGFVDEILVDVGPKEFLGLFRDATYVCTNSYHGLAYSIIFEKDFCLIPCKRFTARINNMLDLLRIDAKVGNTDKRETLMARYDAEYVKNAIAEEREKAIQYLKDSLG